MPKTSPVWLQHDDVRLDVRVVHKRAVLQTIAQMLAASAERPAADVFQALMQREHLGSTALGFGVALPHARIAGLDKTVGAFCRLSQPIDFDAPDDKPVLFVLGLLLPEGHTQHHLDMLAALAPKLSDARFREALAASVDAQDACRLLTAPGV